MLKNICFLFNFSKYLYKKIVLILANIYLSINLLVLTNFYNTAILSGCIIISVFVFNGMVPLTGEMIVADKATRRSNITKKITRQPIRTTERSADRGSQRIQCSGLFGGGGNGFSKYGEDHDSRDEGSSISSSYDMRF